MLENAKDILWRGGGDASGKLADAHIYDGARTPKMGGTHFF